MEDVVINFVSNVQELKPAENAMDSIIQKDKALGEQAAKTSAAMSDWGKKTTEAGKQANTSIEKLITSTKSLDKSIVGGSYKKVLQDLQKEFDLTGKQAKKFLDDLKKDAKLQLLDKDLAAEDRAQLEGLIVAADELLQTVTPLRQRLKEAKEELNGMAEAGKAGTPEFEALKQKAGELDDQMRDLNATVKNVGSDTKNIDGLISLASGVAGGFAVAQGTMALFGSENEEVQQALLKVNAAMAILQGLQQVQNVLQKESAASLLFTRTARAADTTAIQAQTVAQEGQIIATNGAAAATTKLNTVMKLNPVGLIITSVVAAITLFEIFSSKVKDSAEEIERLNKEAEDYYANIQKIAAVNQNEIERNISIIKNAEEVKLLQAKGGQFQKINGLQKESLALETRNLEVQLQGLQSAQEKAADKTLFTERELELKGKIFSNTQQQLLLDIELNKTLQERALKSATSAADADVARKKLAIIQTQVDSLASIKAVTAAEIEAIRIKRNAELANNLLTAGERLKINADAELQIAEIKKEAQIKLLQLEKESIDAAVLLSKKGSEEEFKNKLLQLQKERAIALADAQVTATQKALIEADYTVKKRELELNFQQQVIQNEISYLNAYLERFGVTEERKLELTIRRLDRQRDLEILQAEENAAKIAEINIKYDNLTREARIASINAVLDSNLKTLDVFGNIAKARNETIVNSDRFSYEQRIAANNQLLEADNIRFTLEKGALDKQLQQKNISQEEYNLKLQQLLNQQAANQLQHDEKDLQLFQANLLKKTDSLRNIFAILQSGVNDVFGNDVFAQAINAISDIGLAINKLSQEWDKLTSNEKKEAMMALASEGIVAAQQIIAQSFAESGAARQADLDDRLRALNEQKEKELAVENLTAQNKADIQQKYAEREKVAKREAWLADREAKKGQAIINGLLAVAQTFATLGFPLGIIPAAIVAGLSAVTVLRISSEKVPKFKAGKRKGTYEGFGYVDDGGKIEPIVRADGSVEMASGAAKQRLTYLAKNDTVYPSIAHFLKEFIYPQVPDHVQQAAQGQPFDYEKMAAKIAAQMAGIIPAPAQVTNIISKDGFRSFVKKENETTEFKNERYSMS